MYNLPCINLLSTSSDHNEAEEMESAWKQADLITDCLDQFGMRVEIDNIAIGPQIVRFSGICAEKVAVKKLPSMSTELQYALGAESVTIEAPIPGQKFVGISVSRENRRMVTLGDVIHSAASPLTVPLGVSPENKIITHDIRTMPHLLVGGVTGGGKALALDTPVPTPDGWTTMGEIKIGDKIFDEKGNICSVTKAFSIKYNRPCYEVTFSDGTKVIADADHQWLTDTAFVRNSRNRSSARIKKAESEWAPRVRDAIKHCKTSPVTCRELAAELNIKDHVVTSAVVSSGMKHIGDKTFQMKQNYSGKTVMKTKHARLYDRLDLLKRILYQAQNKGLDQTHKTPKSKIVTTQQIADTVRVKTRNNRANHSIPIAESINLPEKNLILDPYTLGIWLGDGTSSTGCITTADKEVVDRIESNGLKVKPRYKYCYRINNLTSLLRLKKVLNNKHIPLEYLRSSTTQRFQILEGLMDSDGSANKTGSCEFYNTNLKLIEDVYELICSLGIKATINSKKAIYKEKDCGICYIISFTTEYNVFGLKRKTTIQNTNKSRKTNELRYIVSVISTPTVPVRCISVDSNSHLFLISKSYIPTHNSSGLHSLICSLLMTTTPKELMFHMFDSKMTELVMYDGIPNLLAPVITDPYEAVEHFHALTIMMDKRYKLAQELGARTLDEMNEKLSYDDQLPYILVVVDEIADLMLLSKHEVEESITRISGKARAVGIHLILATQSPRREIISGLLKSNLPSRLAFATSSPLDSRIILDKMGAQDLLGKGDAMFSDQGKSPVRLQSPFVSTDEISSIVDFWRNSVSENEELIAA